MLMTKIFNLELLTPNMQIFYDNNSVESVLHPWASPALSCTLLVEDLEKACWSIPVVHVCDLLPTQIRE